MRGFEKEEKLLIKVENLTKKYGSHIAVDNMSFEIKEGEIVRLPWT